MRAPKYDHAPVRSAFAGGGHGNLEEILCGDCGPGVCVSGSRTGCCVSLDWPGSKVDAGTLGANDFTRQPPAPVPFRDSSAYVRPAGGGQTAEWFGCNDSQLYRRGNDGTFGDRLDAFGANLFS